ncbi:MAG: cohesin domain-containing protein [Armatimonadota bacterium]
MIARIAAPFIAACVLLSLCASLVLAQEPVNISLENEFIRIVVNKGPNEAGRFSIKTTGGDVTRPSSKNKHLIFGGNAPWTSYTTLKIDGENYVFGGPTTRRAGRDAKYGEVVNAPTVDKDQILTTFKCGDVEVTQVLRFVRGTKTRMLDTAGITYKFTNRGDSAHQVGLRVLLDTMCGANDGAPIRAAGSKEAFTTATPLAGKDVPEFWQAFDNLSDPTVVSQGTLTGAALSDPDKVLFADWGTLADDSWEPVLSADQGFTRKGEEEVDTTAALFWNPVKLDPGKSIAYTTYYGVGYLNISAGKLTLGLTGVPAETTFEYERTQEFTVVGYLQNTGDFDGKNVTLKLTLPAGLSLVAGKLEQSLGVLKAGDTAQFSWRVKPDGKASGKGQFVLDAASSNIEPNKATEEIVVYVPTPKIQVSPGTARMPLEVNGMPGTTSVYINLVPANKFQGARFTVKYDPNFVMPVPVGNSRSVSCGTAFIDNDRTLGWKFDTSVDGQITITGSRNAVAALTQAETNLAVIDFYAVTDGKSPITIEQAVLIDGKGTEKPVEAANGLIDVVAETTK